MMRVLRSAWRLIVKRAAADWLILSGALVTVVLATALLAAGPIYANAVTLSGAQRTLADAPVRDANVAVSMRTPPDVFDEADAILRAEVARALTSVGADIVRRLSSESYELPMQPNPDATDIGVFRAFEGIESRTTLADGGWPAPTESRIEAAIPESTATRLELQVGDDVVMTNRRDRSVAVTVRIAGIYRVDDPNDPYWFADPVDIEGAEVASSFVTHGPFVVTSDAVLGPLSPRTASLEWRVFPRFDELSVSDIPTIRAGISRFADRLNVPIADGAPEFLVQTDLIRILTEADRSLTVTRSGVVMLSVQLSILAGYALVLTAGLLVDSRLVETYLLHARGAGRSHVFAMAVMEGLLLTVPAAAVAPWFAGRVLTLLSDIGPLAGQGLTIRAAATPSAFGLAFLAAAGCVVALAVPAVRAARLSSGPRRGRRQGATGAAQRAGLDLALLGVAAVAFWQLDTHGASITAQVQGSLGIDPLLIAAPALGLLAGAVLALRTIPLAAALAERVAARGRTTVRALSAWQVSRRPVRYARSGLLLIMAIIIGFFSAAYTSTWSRSQDDQADFQTGADLRVAPNRRVNASTDDLVLRSSHLDLDGVEASMPVVRKTGELARSGQNGRFLLLDADQAPDVVRIRDDLSSVPFAELMQRLVDQRPELAGVSLPGEPARIALAIGVRVAPLPAASPFAPWRLAAEQDDRPPILEARITPSARVVLQDRFGVLHRVALGPIPVDRGVALVDADLVVNDSDGRTLEPAYPLKLVDVEIVSPAPLATPRQAVYSIAGILVDDHGQGTPWQRLDVDLRPGFWGVDVGPVSGMFDFPSIEFAEEQPGEVLRVEIDSGQTQPGFRAVPVAVSFSIRPQGTSLPLAFPVVVSDLFLESTSTRVGDALRLSGLRARRDRAVIVGTIGEFPTVDPAGGPAILVDLATFQMMNYEVGATISAPDEYWLAVNGVSEDVAGSLLLPPFESAEVADRLDRAAALKADPVALGTIGSLALGFVAAAVFAATGFAVSATVSARERLTEFGLLRALGLSQRQLAGWLAIEQSALVAASLVLGTLIGWLLASIILPLIAITQDGTGALPGVIVTYPWRIIAGLEAAVLVVLGVIVSLLAVALRRLGLGSLLRLGED